MTKNFTATGQITKGSAATPSDDPADNFDVVRPGLMIEVAGTVTLVQADDSTLLLSQLIVGVIYNLPHKRIAATGTTATGLISFEI